MKLKKIVLSLVLATLVLSLGSVVWAAEPKQGRFLRGQVPDGIETFAAQAILVVSGQRVERFIVQGTVSDIEDPTLVLDTLQGEKQVTTDEAIFWAPDVENPSLADVQVGDQMVALGRTDEDGNLAARLVAIASAEELREHAVRGRVTAVEGQTLIITTREGDKEVVTTSETYFHIPNVEEPGLEDIEVGRIITALGQKNDDGTFTGQIVAVVRARPRRKIIVRRNMVRGDVTAIGDMTLTVETRQGEKPILILEDTRFRIPGVEDPSLEYIKEGDRIIVLGCRNEDGDFVARVVGVPKRLGLSPETGGRVAGRGSPACLTKRLMGNLQREIVDSCHLLCYHRAVRQHPGRRLD